MTYCYYKVGKTDSSIFLHHLPLAVDKNYTHVNLTQED